MGQWFSEMDYKVSPDQQKNMDYYKGDRSFKISRKYYPHIYSNGYLWGRYEDPTYWTNLGWECRDGEWTRIAYYREF